VLLVPMKMSLAVSVVGCWIDSWTRQLTTQ
jgi:hypothetical protein